MKLPRHFVARGLDLIPFGVSPGEDAHCSHRFFFVQKPRSEVFVLNDFDSDSFANDGYIGCEPYAILRYFYIGQ